MNDLALEPEQQHDAAPSTHRVAAAVSDIELAAYQRAARLVLRHPVITAATPRPGDLAAVRRWAPELRDDLATLTGTRLEVTPHLARLVRRPTRLDPTHPLLSRSGRPFDARRYAYLCLALAELLRCGPQVLLTDLAEHVKRRADGIAGLGLDPDVHTHRTALVDAIRALEALDALSARDGSTGSYANDPTEGDALYDVDADVATGLFQPPTRLQHLDTAADLVVDRDAAGRDTRRRAIRQRLTRRLLDHPLLLLADCSGEEIAYLRREAGRVAADVERLTGCAVERRSEGLALLDTAGELTDHRFPGNGTVSQVALILCDTLGARPVGSAQVALPRLADADATLVAALDTARPTAAPSGARQHDGATPGAPEPEPAPSGARQHDGATPGAPEREREPAPSGARQHDGATPGAPEREAPEPTPVLFVARAELEAALADATTRYGPAFKGDLRDDPARLLDLALAELADFDLVRPVAGGVAVAPAAARYRSDAVFVPATEPSLFDAPSADAAAPTNDTADTATAPTAATAPTDDAATPTTDTADTATAPTDDAATAADTGGPP